MKFLIQRYGGFSILSLTVSVIVMLVSAIYVLYTSTVNARFAADEAAISGLQNTQQNQFQILTDIKVNVATICEAVHKTCK